MVDDGEALDSVRRHLSTLWPEFDWNAARYDRGAFHDVLIIEAADVVARISRSKFAADAAGERNTLLRQIANRVETFQTPVPIGEPERWSERHVAVLHTFVPGQDAKDLSGDDSDEIRRVIDSFHDFCDVFQSTSVRSFCGAADFPGIVEHLIAPKMADECARRARLAIEQLVAAEAEVIAQPIHGDLNSFNLRWADRKVVGVLDWDHAAMGDPAIDVAGILTSIGTSAAASIADAETLHRASLHRATFPLQIAAAGLLHDDERLMGTGIRNFEQRCRDSTLQWPADQVHLPHHHRPTAIGADHSEAAD